MIGFELRGLMGEMDLLKVPELQPGLPPDPSVGFPQYVQQMRRHLAQLG